MPVQTRLDINGLIRRAIKVQTPMSFLHHHKARSYTNNANLPQVSLSPRERWRFAIRTVMKLLHNLKYHAGLRSKKIDNAPGVNERSLSYALKEFQYQGDLIFSTKIQEYLNGSARSEEDIATFNRLLMTRLPSFAKFSYDQRIRFLVKWKC
eukprot:jgi/Hompol1/1403/HPOL_005455-RA